MEDIVYTKLSELKRIIVLPNSVLHNGLSSSRTVGWHRLTFCPLLAIFLSVRARSFCELPDQSYGDLLPDVESLTEILAGLTSAVNSHSEP